VQLSYNNAGKRSDKTFVDGAIRAKTVLVIDGESGNNLGVMPLFKALNEARERGLNLVQMSPGNINNPPTCKILDYGKLKYDESKKVKAQQKKQRESRVEDKEIVFRPDTALNDLRVKANKVIEFLDEGDRVKVTIKCVGREANHPEVFRNTLNIFRGLVPNAVAAPLTNELRGKFSYLITRNDPNGKKNSS
jgi:translation initiation factor IF-3